MLSYSASRRFLKASQVVGFLLYLATAAIGASERTWTMRDGTTISARYVRQANKNACLVQSDGIEKTIPISTLSDVDQRFVESLAKCQRATPPNDVLVTSSGSYYFGVISEDANEFVILKPDGSSVRRSKDVVKHVYKGLALARQFQDKLTTTDLMDDKAVTRLAQQAKKFGLEPERDGLLTHTYLLRREKADADSDRPSSLRELASWCDTNRLTYADECRKIASQAEFPKLMKDADGDAVKLAHISVTYRNLNLVEEARSAESAARRFAPNDPQISDILTAAWTVQLLKAEKQAAFRETSGTSTLSVKPASGSVAIIRLRFRAVRPGDTSSLEQEKEIRATLVARTPEAKGLLPNNFKQRPPCRTLISSNVTLRIDDTLITPRFTSLPPGSGATVAGGELSVTLGDSTDFIRAEGVTMLLASVQADCELSFVYEIPSSSREAELVFENLPPLAVKF